MISQNERYIFVCEVAVRTYFNFFPPPTGKQLFLDLHALQQAKGALPMPFGAKRASITDMKWNGDKLSILFRMADPEIPDNALENAKSGTVRIAQRLKDESPAVSAHMILDLDPTHDRSGAYPCVIENVDWLSRSQISGYLNELFAKNFSTDKAYDGSGATKKYQPRLELRGHQSSTISAMLSNGCKLHGLQFITTEVKSDVFGDPSYPVDCKTEQVFLMKAKPTGALAGNWLVSKVNALQGKYTKAKVMIEDLSGRVKTSQIDQLRSNVLDSFFISQKLISGFSRPLLLCEDRIRTDLESKMTVELP